MDFSPVPAWFLLLLTVLSFSCTRQERSGVAESVLSGPSKESWNVRIVLSQANSDEDESLTRLIISADHVQWMGERDSTIQHLQGLERKVQIEIYDSSGVFSAFPDADQISYYESEDYFIAEGGVMIETKDDRTLVTERIEWWEADQLLKTESSVHIRTPDEVVSGMGLEATEDLRSYQIGPFTAEIVRDQ